MRSEDAPDHVDVVEGPRDQIRALLRLEVLDRVQRGEQLPVGPRGLDDEHLEGRGRERLDHRRDVEIVGHGGSVGSTRPVRLNATAVSGDAIRARLGAMNRLLLGMPAKQKPKSTFTAAERAAMKERSRELKKGKGDGEADVLAKIAAMAQPDRAMAERLHAIVKASAPALTPKTWYGMPAYARNDKVVCFFQSGAKFGTRYATLGFSDKANLDDGAMWPTAFALTKLTAVDEARIAELVKRAAG